MGFEVYINLAEVKLPHDSARAAAREIFDYFLTLRNSLTNEVRGIMRQGVSSATGGLSEKESVVATVTPGMIPGIRVASSLIKAAVDEKGRLPGGMPPFGPGSLLQEWVIGTLAPDPKAVLPITRKIAQNILMRGLPRPGDPLRAPFGTVFKARLPEIRLGLAQAGDRAAQAINRRTE